MGSLLAAALLVPLTASPIACRPAAPSPPNAQPGLTDHHGDGERHHTTAEHHHATTAHHQTGGEHLPSVADNVQAQSAAGPEACCAKENSTPRSFAVPSAVTDGRSQQATHSAAAYLPNIARSNPSCQVHHLVNCAIGSPPAKHKPFGSLLI